MSRRLGVEVRLRSRDGDRGERCPGAAEERSGDATCLFEQLPPGRGQPPVAEHAGKAVPAALGAEMWPDGIASERAAED